MNQIQVKHVGDQLTKWISVQVACANFKASFAADPTREFTVEHYLKLQVATNWLVEQATGCSIGEAMFLPEDAKIAIILEQDILNGLHDTALALQFANRGKR